MSASDPESASPAGVPTTQIDLATALARGELTLSAESREDPLDKQHRHSQEAADARLRRWKDGARFSLSALLLLALSGTALVLALSATSSGDEKTWARAALLSVLTGVGGYFVGRGSKE